MSWFNVVNTAFNIRKKNPSVKWWFAHVHHFFDGQQLILIQFFVLLMHGISLHCALVWILRTWPFHSSCHGVLAAWTFVRRIVWIGPLYLQQYFWSKSTTLGQLATSRSAKWNSTAPCMFFVMCCFRTYSDLPLRRCPKIVLSMGLPQWFLFHCWIMFSIMVLLRHVQVWKVRELAVSRAFVATQMIPTIFLWFSLNGKMVDSNWCMRRSRSPSSLACKAERKNVATPLSKYSRRQRVTSSSTLWCPDQVMSSFTLVLWIPRLSWTAAEHRWFPTKPIASGIRWSPESGPMHRYLHWRIQCVKFGSTPGETLQRRPWYATFRPRFFPRKRMKQLMISWWWGELKVWILPHCSGTLLVDLARFGRNVGINCSPWNISGNMSWKKFLKGVPRVIQRSIPWKTGGIWAEIWKMWSFWTSTKRAIVISPWRLNL